MTTPLLTMKQPAPSPSRPRGRLLQTLITVLVVLVQLTTPILVLAQGIRDERVLAAQRAALAERRAEQALTPDEMQAAFDLLLSKMPGRLGMRAAIVRPDYRHASRLIVDDYRALVELPDDWMWRPLRQRMGLMWGRLPYATQAELNTAFMWLLTAVLNFPADLSEAESQQIERAFENGILALALHFQVLAEQAPREQTDVTGGTTGDQAATDLRISHALSGEATSIEPARGLARQDNAAPGSNVAGQPGGKKYMASLSRQVLMDVAAAVAPAASADGPADSVLPYRDTDVARAESTQTKFVSTQQVIASAAGAVPSTQSPGYSNEIASSHKTLLAMTPPERSHNSTADGIKATALAQETRLFGNLRVTADVFTDLGGGQVRASGHVVLGAAGAAADHYQLIGASDAVTLAGAALTGQGTLVLRVGSVQLFQGNFSADGAAAQPLVIPAEPVWLLNALGDFPIQGAPSITQVNLFTGAANGRAQVRVTPPGIEQALGVNFGLSPGPVASGQMDDFGMTVAGSALAVSGAQLSNAAIQAVNAVLTLSSAYGGGNQTISGFKLLPNALELGGSPGASFAIPNIIFGDGSRVKIVGNQATLQTVSGVLQFGIGGTLVLSLPSNPTQNIALNFSLDTQGNLHGSVGAISLAIAGFTLGLTGSTLDKHGLTMAEADLTAPAWLGGASIKAEQISITKDGLRFKGGVTLSLPVLRFSDHFKIVGASATLNETGNAYSLSVGATLYLKLDSQEQNIAFNFTVDADGDFSGQVSQIILPLVGGSLSLRNVAFSNDGLDVASGQLRLPPILGETTITVTDIRYTKDGLSLAGGAQIAFPDLVLGDGSVLKITGVTASLKTQNGVNIFEAQGTLRLNLASTSLTVDLGFMLDNHGYIGGSLASLTLTVAGLTLTLSDVVLDNTGLNVDTARLALPARFGGESIAVQDVSITHDGLSIGCGVLYLPDIKFGDGTKFRIAGVKVLLRVDQGVYTFEASGTLRFHLTNNDQDIPVSFSIDSNGNLDATLSGFTITLDNFALTVGPTELTNDGLTIASATLLLPDIFGHQLTVTVTGIAVTKDGLSIHGEIDLPDINFGNGQALRIQNIKATFNSTASGYIFSANAMLVINPFNSAILIPLQFSIDTHANFSGVVGPFSLPFFLGTLTLSGGTINNQGVTIGGATWQWWDWAGGLTVSLPGVTFDQDGIKIEGGLVIDIPNIRLGNAATITGAHGAITVQNGIVFLDVQGTLELHLPSNAQSISLRFTADTAGHLSGTISLSLNLAGCSLQISNMGLSHDSQGLRFSVDRASLTLPSWMHLPSLVIKDLSIDRNGLTIGGGFDVALPDFSLFDTDKASLKFTQNTLTLTQRKSGDQTIYVWTLSGTLTLKVPPAKFLWTTGIQGKLDGGEISVSLSEFAMQFAGCTLTVKSATLDRTGIKISTAVLTLPAWANHFKITVQSLAINAEGLSVDIAGFPIPDINLGGAVTFRNMVGWFGLQISYDGLGLYIKIDGTLSLRIGKHINLDVILRQTQIGTNGAFSGMVDSLSLKLSESWQLVLSNVKFDNTMLYVDYGTLITPLGTFTVHRVRINGIPPFIHFSGGPGGAEVEYVPDPPIAYILDGQDFYLQALPSEVALNEGGGGAALVSVVGVNDATAPVHLSLSDPPVGLLYSFNTTLLLPGESAALAMTDTELLEGGSYALQITGVDISHTHTTTLALNVVKPHFDLSVMPDAQTVRPGATAMYTLSLTSSGWSQPVGLSSGPSTHLPEGVTAGFRISPDAAPTDAITVTAPVTVYLSVTSPATATLGTFLLDVLAQSGEKQKADDVILTLWKPSCEIYMPLIRR